MKYSNRIKDKICNLLSEDNYTYSEVCRIVGISERILYKWKAENPEFAEAISKAKEELIAKTMIQAEKSLHKIIKGYDAIEIQERTRPDGFYEKIISTRHHPPDTNAIIRYLCTHDPEHWSFNKSIELTGRRGRPLFPEGATTVRQHREFLESLNDDQLDSKIEEIKSKQDPQG